MKTLPSDLKASPATIAVMSPPSRAADQGPLPFERTSPCAHLALCAHLARLLRRSLRGLDWGAMPAGERDGLRKALTGLGADIPLLWLIRGQADDAARPDRPHGKDRP